MNDFVIKKGKEVSSLKFLDDNTAKIGEKEISYSYHKENIGQSHIIINNKVYEVELIKNESNKFIVSVNGQIIELDVLTALQEKAFKMLEDSNKSKHSKTEVRSPMPGMVLKIKKNPNDDIKKGDVVLILEAMKMENEIKAPAEGKLTDIFVKEGLAIEKNAILFTIV